MTNSVTADSIRYLWQKMPADTVLITADEMRARARKFQARIRIRNFIEYIAAGFVVVVFGWYATWPSKSWLWIPANVTIVLGTLLVVFNLYRRGRAVATPATASTSALIEFQRAELARQRDALLTTWRWYFLPFVPGFALFTAALWMSGPTREGVSLARFHTGLIGVSALFALIVLVGVLLHLLGAAHLQRRIEDLDRYKEKP
jgi:hypothetical protein